MLCDIVDARFPYKHDVLYFYDDLIYRNSMQMCGCVCVCVFSAKYLSKVIQFLKRLRCCLLLVWRLCSSECKRTFSLFSFFFIPDADDVCFNRLLAWMNVVPAS